MPNINNWESIWGKRTTKIQSDVLGSLIKANGFDTGFGDYTTEQWMQMTSKLCQLLGVVQNSKILEVGCGSGALLYGLNKHSKAKIYGYDYSQSLINLASAFVNGQFALSEAISNPFDSIEFDFVVSHSVFQYFPNLEYAFRTIDVMHKAVRVGGTIALLDLNDAAIEENYHADRRKSYTSPSQYDDKYANHPHLFFNREIIANRLQNLGFTGIFFPEHPIANYVNSKYRFNVLGTRIK